MVTPTWHLLNTITKDTMWRDDLKSLADEIIGKGLFDDIPAAHAFLDEADTLRVAKGNCGKPDESPACKVETRYIYLVFRNTPKESVLAQALLGFELASVDPRVVGINLVGAEDAYAAMAEFADQMWIFAYVGGLYPKVAVSLHAGELAPGLVPPEGLCCHVRQAIEVADADRFGHGVDVMYENDPEALLKDMAAKHVMVEINLTSNDDVLGIQGQAPPVLDLPQVRAYRSRSRLMTRALSASISRMNTCARSRATTSHILI
jgi:adenosine deaminase